MTALEEAQAVGADYDGSRTGDRARRPRRRLVWPALGAVVIVVGAGVWLWTGRGSSDSSSAAVGPVATATVEQGTISATASWPGTLDYGAPFTIRSSAAGTITRLVAQGETVERGGELYRVNERPVIVFYGVVPMYRDLAPGMSGVDVAQLEANLATLGYATFTADEAYTAETADAVRAWQGALGAEQTGTVARGDIVFVLDVGRVDALHVGIGDAAAPGASVLDLTGTAKVVSLDIAIEDRDRFDIGTTVTVVLPDDDEALGTVSASTVVEVPAAPEGGPGGEQTETQAVVAVEVSLSDEIDDGLVGAPVDVVVAIDERTDVLLVPVSALLALSEGGYGLEVVRDDETTKIVAVDPGLFANGKVQVEGDGIGDGTVVGVAGR